MQEKFPVKRPGDRLAAEHVNNLSRVCKRVDSGNRGTGLSSFFGSFRSSFIQTTALIWQVKVTNDNSNGTYDVSIRYYDHETSSWKTQVDGKKYQNDTLVATELGNPGGVTLDTLLDTTETGQSFEVGDRVTAYWNAQRNAFIPLTGAVGAVLKVGKAVDLIEPLDIGEVRIWKDGSETEEIVENVQHDWITGDQAVEKDAEVIIGYFSDEGVWRIIGAECP